MTDKTSTFTIRHDRCKPDTWTARDVLAFANFIRFGEMRYAAELSRLGVQLVMSELHEPKGGTLQEIGFASASVKYPVTDGGPISDDIGEVVDDDDISEVCRVYRGPTEYAVRVAEGDGEGNFEGYFYEFKPSKVEAEAFLLAMQNAA